MHKQVLDDGSLAVQNKDDGVIWSRGKQGTRFTLRDTDSNGAEVCNVILEDRSSVPYKCIWDSLDSCPKPPSAAPGNAPSSAPANAPSAVDQAKECGSYVAPDIKGECRVYVCISMFFFLPVYLNVCVCDMGTGMQG